MPDSLQVASLITRAKARPHAFLAGDNLRPNKGKTTKAFVHQCHANGVNPLLDHGGDRSKYLKRDSHAGNGHEKLILDREFVYTK